VQPLPGTNVEELDTPCLVVDLDAVDRNIARMAETARKAGLALRPHAKTHKSARFGRRQVAAGAVGLCCPKVGEVEAVVAGGIADILLTNEIVGAPKLARLAALARQATVRTVVDNAEAAAALGAAARAAGLTLGVLVDCDLGQARTGIADPAAAAELGRFVSRTDGLRFDGLQAYHGGIQHVVGWAARKAASDAANRLLAQFRAAFAAAGLSPAIVSGAGTGTFGFQGQAGYTEWQCGTYIFMDRQYRDIGGADGGPYEPFEQALTVLTTVMSLPSPDRFVVDAGLKSLSVDGGMPAIRDLPGWNFAFGGDEHGKLLRASPDAARPKLGEKLHAVPGHGDTTINLHDEYFVVSGGKLVGVWPVEARGKVR
jgi:3-hydroxy-D-aspartate aldolase